MDHPANSGILSGQGTQEADSKLEPSPPDVQTILTRRHKAAATTVAGLLIAIVLLSVVAFLGKGYFRQQPDRSIDLGVRVAVLILGIGSVFLRRRSLSSTKLQDIVERKGAGGLIGHLEKTTLKIALIGAAIAAIGFVGTLVTGDDVYTYLAGIVAIIVLLFHFPRRSFWARVVEQFAGTKYISSQAGV